MAALQLLHHRALNRRMALRLSALQTVLVSTAVIVFASEMRRFKIRPR
jgi:hypothetical protein